MADMSPPPIPAKKRRVAYEGVPETPVSSPAGTGIPPSTLRIKLSNRKGETKENIPETPMRPPRRMVKVVNLTEEAMEEEDQPLIRKRNSGAHAMIWSDEDEDALNREIARAKDSSF